MKKLLPITACLFLFSCGNKESENKTDTGVAVNTPVVATISDIQALRPNIDLMPWEGSLSDAIYWKDSRGENAVVISINPQFFWEEEKPNAKEYFPKGEDAETLSELTEIFITHFVLKSGENKWQVYNQSHDYLFGCCDVFMEYQPASLQVMDADSNGTGEVMLMYHQTEADGILDHSYTGTLLLELDSAYYTIKDESGLGAQIRLDNEPGYKSQVRKENLPANPAYATLMKSKWDELFKAKVELDRKSVTEQNNVDEAGHQDHHH